MLARLFSKCIVSPDMIKPSQDDMEVIGAFNPGVVEYNGITYFLIRVAERPKEKRKGLFPLPKVEKGKIVVDWYKKKSLKVIDERLVRTKPEGYLYLTNVSHFRLAKSKDGINIDSIAEFPAIFPEEEYEEFGVEDARITRIDGKFYITYVAVSRHGIVTALASTQDFVHFKKHGIIFSAENKDIAIFPEKIKDRYVAFHRPLSANPFGPPEIWLAYSKDLLHWGDHRVLFGASPDNGFREVSEEDAKSHCACRKRRAADWDSMKIGAGAPPIKTNEGWLEIYHGSYREHEEDTVGVYCAGGALFELEDPSKLIAKAKCPVFIPEKDYECEGFLGSIVFPSGIVVKGDELSIYYGAADTCTAVVKMSLKTVMTAIKIGCHNQKNK